MGISPIQHRVFLRKVCDEKIDVVTKSCWRICSSLTSKRNSALFVGIPSIVISRIRKPDRLTYSVISRSAGILVDVTPASVEFPGIISSGMNLISVPISERATIGRS